MNIDPPPPKRDRPSELVNNPFAKLSFSQFGEDQLIWQKLRTSQNKFYVDVGCHHPFRYSNTALLANFHGWRGINVDPDIRAIEQFQKHRPHDINVHCAVDREAGETTIFLFDDGAVNSIDPAAAALQAKSFGEPRADKVIVAPLRDILKQHLPYGVAVDYLNIDAEWRDQAVLESNDWDLYRPQLVTVEAHEFNPGNPTVHPTFQFMTAQGYVYFAHFYCTSFYELR